MLVFREEAELLARALGCRLLRTSVKEDVNVNAVFRHLASRCLAELREQEDDYALTNNGIHPLTISKWSLLMLNKFNTELDFNFCAKDPWLNVSITTLL